MKEGIASCSFTGHRVIPEANKAAVISLLGRAVEYAYGRGVREFYCGGALGFDTLAAREVIRFKLLHPDVRLILLLPCKDQDMMWSGAERDAYEFTLVAADEVVYVSDSYTKDCMKKRNLALVSRADIIIAYCSRMNSGAGQTMRFAKAAGKEVYNLFPTTDRM